MTDLIKVTLYGFSIPKLLSFNFRSCVLDLAFSSKMLDGIERRAIVGGFTFRRETVYHVQLL